jgi:hypothetical protein
VLIKRSSVANKMFKVAILVCGLIAISSARIRPCDRGVLGPLPVAHRIDNCPDPNQVCEIIRGKDIVATMDFIASK